MTNEQDQESTTSCRGVPHGCHAHVLVGAGQRQLDAWFPGIAHDLLVAGAVPVDTRGMVWHQGGGCRIRPDLGVAAMSVSRPLLECTVRDRLLQT